MNLYERRMKKLKIEEDDWWCRSYEWDSDMGPQSDESCDTCRYWNECRGEQARIRKEKEGTS